MSSLRSMLIFVLLAVLACDAEARRPVKKLCKIDYLLECYNEAIWYFTAQPAGTGIASNETEMEQFCFQNHDYLPYCVKQWFNRCGSPMHAEMFQRLFTEPIQQSMKVFCNSKGEIRSKFLKHAPCLIEKVKLAADYRSTCVRNLQSSSEVIHERAKEKSSLSYLLRNQCCAYNQWEQCISNQLREKCSTEAGDIFPNLIHYSSIDILKGICPMTLFNPNDSKQCNPDDFHAPPEYVPKGIKSGSFASYYFSYLCPNVGFGIDESRDS